jgi:hypothetical protein
MCSFAAIRSRLSAVWAWIGSNHEQLTLLFAVVAGAYVLVEYKNNETDANIKRVMEFQARYGQREILAARKNLDAFWLNPASDAERNAAPGSAAEKITAVVLKHKLDGDVFVVADFFDQVAICIRTDLCHLKTACTIFKSEVDGLRNTYFDLFKKWEKRWGENRMEANFKYFGSKCPKPTSAE